MENERKAGGKFVDLMLPADAKTGTVRDQAFLLHFDREVELLEDFTSSRDKLHRELDGMGPTSSERNSSNGPETSGDERSSQRGSRGGGTQLYDAIFLASDELMKPKDGRKALVVFSDGEDRGSKENMNDAIDAADHANVAVYTVYFKGEQERQMGEGFPGGGRRGGGGGWPGGVAAAIRVGVAEDIQGAGAVIPAAVVAGVAEERADRQWTARRLWNR